MLATEIIHDIASPLSTLQGKKIPWDEAEFSQRMLANHLAQEHDWASRRSEIIRQHTAWISRQLTNTSAQILDLGCGPGLYLQQLAQSGYCCTGVDFSPASIAYAIQQAAQSELAIHYHCADICQFSPLGHYDFVMMIFGEFNVFPKTTMQQQLANIYQWLKPDGQLVLEVHTQDEIRRQGLQAASWQRYPHGGLFSVDPHLLLQENSWNELTQTTTNTYWVMDEQAAIQRFTSHMQAYTETDYLQLLTEAGFLQIEVIPAEQWLAGDDFSGKLITYHSYKR